MSTQISNLNYIERNVGSKIKSSKKQYIWEFTIDEKDEKIEFFDSHLSLKRKVIVNGQIIYDKQDSNPNQFVFNFQLDGHYITINKTFERVDLRIDSESFEHTYHLEKNKLFYNKNPEPTVYRTVGNTVDNRNNYNLRDNFYSHQNQNQNQNLNQPKLFDFHIKGNDKVQQGNFGRFKFGGDDNNVNQNNINQTNNQTNFQNREDNYNTNQTGNLLDLDVTSSNNNNNNGNFQQSNNDLLSDVFGGNQNNNMNNYNYNNQGLFLQTAPGHSICH